MTHPIDTYVGSQIKKIRLAMNLSQSDLARQLDISFQQIQKYETGYNRVSASKLAQIAANLDVPVSAFFPESFQDRSLNSDERSLLENYRAADPDAKSSLMTISSKIAEVHHA